MELRQLAYLDKVVAAGGFRSAARELGVSQPTLTAGIKQLELHMGVMLIDRGRRPIRATPYGEIVVARAREVFASLDRLNADLADIAARQTGRLRLGTNQWVARGLPPLLAAFASRYPNIDVLQRRVMSREAAKLMLSGSLDVCLLALREDDAPLPRQIESTRLFSFEHVFAVLPSHRLAERSEIGLEDLVGGRLVLSTGEGSSGMLLRQALSAAGVDPHAIYESDDMEMVPSLVQQGVGIGFTPEFMVTRSHPILKTFRVANMSLKNDALLTWPTRLRGDPALRAFIAFVTSQRWEAARSG